MIREQQNELRTIRVCLCFKPDLLRVGVIRALESTLDIEITAVAASPAELPAVMKSLPVHLVLIDADAFTDSLLALWKLSHIGITARIVAMGLDHDSRGADLAMKCGAHLCLPKTATGQDLREAIRQQIHYSDSHQRPVQENPGAFPGRNDIESRIRKLRVRSLRQERRMKKSRQLAWLQ